MLTIAPPVEQPSSPPASMLLAMPDDEADDDTREPDASASEVVIPWERLSPAALRGVIEEFVTREGTEYGFDDVSLDQKVADVQRQLERGDACVLFHAVEKTVNVVRTRDLAR